MAWVVKRVELNSKKGVMWDTLDSPNHNELWKCLNQCFAKSLSLATTLALKLSKNHCDKEQISTENTLIMDVKYRCNCVIFYSSITTFPIAVKCSGDNKSFTNKPHKPQGSIYHLQTININWIDLLFERDIVTRSWVSSEAAKTETEFKFSGGKFSSFSYLSPSLVECTQRT